ncbi:CRISPR-associated endoribonuclease Cas6 [Oxyplasma meridianum]|uniref:CRISPR-associated endoribonuclease Cas6 n=1 Tax=Oxyplasma meridianum TaxID=3073602 RepID=A0AAX4NEG0_9ARCH
MHLIVNLDSNNFEMPYDHSYQLYSSILALVDNQNEAAAEKLHGFNPSSKFSMSQIMPGGKREFTRTGFRGERFIFILSSLDSSIINLFEDSFRSAEFIELFKNKFKIYSILKREVFPTSEIVTIKTKSPAILKDKGKYLLNESDELILSTLKTNIINKYNKVRGTKPEIRFIKILGLKRKLLDLKGTKLPALMITFTMSADIEIIKFILEVGIGSKNKLGFGFIEEEKAGDANVY